MLYVPPPSRADRKLVFPAIRRLSPVPFSQRGTFLPSVVPPCPPVLSSPPALGRAAPQSRRAAGAPLAAGATLLSGGRPAPVRAAASGSSLPLLSFPPFSCLFFFFFAGVGCVGVSVPRRGQSLLSVLPSQAMLVLKRQPAAERSHEHTDTYDPLPAIACSAGEAKSSFRRVQRFSLVHSSNVLLPYLCTRGRRMVPPSFLAPRALFPCSQRLHPLLAPITSRTRSLTASQLDFCSIQTAFGPQQPPTAPTTYLVFDISGLK